MSTVFQKGKFIPRNPDKYKGNINNIKFRSSWELSFHQFLDNNPNILEWASEEIAIPYVKPTDGKIHKYYPDYWIKYKNKHDKIVQEMIEVKPASQIKQPTVKGKKPKQQLYEQITYVINIAKWQAAQNFCDKYDIKFRIITENELFK